MFEIKFFISNQLKLLRYKKPIINKMLANYIPLLTQSFRIMPFYMLLRILISHPSESWLYSQLRMLLTKLESLQT